MSWSPNGMGTCWDLWTPNVLVAERDGHLLGAVVLKLLTLPHNRKGGLVYWAFTAPEARGLGLGGSLDDASVGRTTALRESLAENTAPGGQIAGSFR
jgi:hypothetical protein